MAADPTRYDVHFEDETHVETNPCLGRGWHRVGQQAIVPAAGTNRRLTIFGSVAAAGAGRIELVGARADSAGFARYLAALDTWHDAHQRQVMLVLDNGSCHTSKRTRQALAARTEWLEVIYLSRYSPQLNPKEREWRLLKRDHRSHLAPSNRAFVDVLLAGLRQLGGNDCEIIDEVPDWWLAGHRKEPTGRSASRSTGAADAPKRQPRSTINLPAPT